MFWIYLLLATVGIVAIVPTVLRFVDGLPHNVVTGFVGFAGTAGGLVGLFCGIVGFNNLTTFLVAAGFAVVAGPLSFAVPFLDAARTDDDSNGKPQNSRSTRATG